MQTILGPFHPDLENALVDEVLKHKKVDSLCPLLVLTPSDLLRRRLKVVLSRENGLSLLNTQLLTFYQLALRLREEISQTPLRLQSDLFFEEALRQMIRQRQPGAEPFAGIEKRAGGCAALWQTLRDLRDGMVDPAVALEALTEGHFSRRASERTAELLVLLRTFQEFCRRQNIVDQSALILNAIGQVAHSNFLQQFSQIVYYGFYDLTQIQLDLFHAVARHFPTTLFFPLLDAQPAHEGWSFAARFYERHVQGWNAPPPCAPASHASLPAAARVFDAIESRHLDFPAGWKCRIVSAFGAADEIATAAKEILKLVDDGAAQFHEIGVVARSLDSYGPIIKEVFHQHSIPLAGTFEEPLAQAPLTKAVILLLNLPARDFLRNQVIDLLSSPYFRFPYADPKSLPFRPDLWDLATRELAICKGAAEWQRLRRYSRRDLALRQISQDEEPRKIRIPAAQLNLLANVVDELANDLLRLPDRASWQAYASAWKMLLEKYLGVARERETTAPADAVPRIAETILDILDDLTGLDSVENRVALSDFTRTLQHWLERSRLTDDRRNRDGVMALNATAARGVSFRALFVLGMNEGVFPRMIREDAFLRDRDREVLERDLGYKISQKLTAFDEEKLLFTLLVGSARERLYCSFQRADESGRALAPSWYIDELTRAFGQGGQLCERTVIPRGIAEKAAVAPFDRDNLLQPQELAIRLILEGRDPTTLIEISSPLPDLYQHGRRAVAAIDRSYDRLLPYDGALTDFDHYWKHVAERGLSPTALETYARCPFQFFARHVLGLDPIDRPEETLGPSAADFGELGHGILNSFYQSLIDRGYFKGSSAKVDVETTLQSVAARAFAEYEEGNPVGYALAWESLKTGMIQTLRQVIARDLSEMVESGFAPASLETDMTTRLPGDWPEPLPNLAIRGRMDRIDQKDGALRVIDYKFKLGAKPASPDKNLLRAALRGERLQPPFYYLLAQSWAEKQVRGGRPPAIAAEFYFIAPRWAEGPLQISAYGSEGLAGKAGAETRQTIAYLADGVRRGRFFINRGEYCGYCDAAPICRKNHPPSLWRAENDPASETHRALRGKTSKDDEHEADSD